MSAIVKKCPKLRKDRSGQWFCCSTHICYKTVCYSSLFETVQHTNGATVTHSYT